ncbi:type II toxin-antitoxin system RelE/ParE family toxin [Streptomyces niveus]
MAADVVHKELAKCRLAKDDMIKLGRLMARAQEGTLLRKDSKNLGDGLHELRLDCGERIYRLFYSPAGNDLVLLALKFVNKKAKQGIATDPGDIESARKRLAEWQSRQSGDDHGGDALK